MNASNTFHVHIEMKQFGREEIDYFVAFCNKIKIVHFPHLVIIVNIESGSPRRIEIHENRHYVEM